MDLLADLGLWGPVLTVAGIYALIAMGLQVQVGHAGLLNFGQVGFVLLGAYGSAIAVAEHGASLFVGTLVGIAVAVLAALVLAIPTVRLRGDFLAITAIAGSELLRIVALNEVELTKGSSGYNALGFRVEVTRPLLRSLDEAGWDVDRVVPLLVMTWILVLAFATALWLLMRTPWGRLVRAVRDDEQAVRALGHDAFKLKTQALAVGAVPAAVAGTLYGWNLTRFSPNSFEPLVTFIGFIIVILAGLGSIWGAVLLATLFQGLVEYTRFRGAPFVDLDLDLTSAQESALRWVFVGVVLMLVIGLRPQGIFGRRRDLGVGDD